MTNCTSFEISNNIFIVIAVCYGIVGLMAAIFNSMIFLAMVKDPLKKLRTTFNYLVVNLCVFDFLNGVIGLPLFFIQFRFLDTHNETPTSNWLSIICSILPNTILIGVFYSICALSIDRYKAIVHPIKYRQNMSWRRCIKYMLALWFVAISSSLMFLINNIVVATAWRNFNVILVSVVLLIVYIRVRKSLRSHNTEFEERMKESLIASQETVKSRLKTEQKITRVYSVILMTVLITTLPGLVILDFTALYQDVDCLVGFIAFNVRLLLLYSNSVMNPLVCMFMLKNFKESIKVMFCCCI